MIYVKDNFLKPQLFKALVDYADDFTEVKTPGKSFWVKELPVEFENLLVNELKAIERKPIHIIKAFIRKAEGDQDSEWRIHNDTIIEGQQPADICQRAIYIESNAEEFNRMLIEDANDKSKWKLKSIIGYKPNRLLSYPCNYFHSKYPNKFKEPRKVLVIFYK